MQSTLDYSKLFARVLQDQSWNHAGASSFACLLEAKLCLLQKLPEQEHRRVLLSTDTRIFDGQSNIINVLLYDAYEHDEIDPWAVRQKPFHHDCGRIVMDMYWPS